MQTIYIVNERDNVGVAVERLEAGAALKIGALRGQGDELLTLLQDIEQGHKAALCDIACDDQIIKYGIPIGLATRDIRKGEWVHLHNMRSAYDERSSHIDPEKGIIMDTKYE